MMAQYSGLEETFTATNAAYDEIMVWQLAKSRTPGHDPADEPLPAWVDEWHAAYDSGADVTTYEGARL